MENLRLMRFAVDFRHGKLFVFDIRWNVAMPGNFLQLMLELFLTADKERLACFQLYLLADAARGEQFPEQLLRTPNLNTLAPWDLPDRRLCLPIRG